MDSLNLLHRRYLDIAGRAGVQVDSHWLRELRTWLLDDVVPELHHLAKRPSFREQARWPLDHLLAGSASDERKNLEELDKLIVDTAKNLMRIMGKESFQKRAGTRFISERPDYEEILITGDAPPKVLKREMVRYCRVEEACGHVVPIAARFWNDLVSAGDYFEPAVGWPTDDPAKARIGAPVVSLTPELHQGGDFVSRCVVRRIEFLTEQLREAIRMAREVSPELEPVGAPPKKEWSKIIESFVAAKKLEKLVRHQLLEHEQQPLRDACILLTQVGAASSSQFDLEWLADAGWRQHFSMGYRLEQPRTKELYDRIALALVRLRDFFAQQPVGLTAYEEAVARNGLVVREEAQDAVWKGETINADWSTRRKEWQLFVLLAKAVHYGKSVGDDDSELYPDPPGRTSLAMLCGRMKRNLPADLRRYIVPGGKPRSYRFDLERSQVTVL